MTDHLAAARAVAELENGSATHGALVDAAQTTYLLAKAQTLALISIAESLRELTGRGVLTRRED